MLKTRIIPCLDVKDGRVVKGVNFVDLVDAGDPVEQAKVYDRAGADELCFLDITASHENRGTILDVARQTAEQCFIPLTIGGGVRTLGDIRNLLQQPRRVRARSKQSNGFVHACGELLPKFAGALAPSLQIDGEFLVDGLFKDVVMGKSTRLDDGEVAALITAELRNLFADDIKSGRRQELTQHGKIE